MRVTGDDAGVLLLLRQAIPCILHCENRCGKPMLRMETIKETHISIKCSSHCCNQNTRTQNKNPSLVLIGPPADK
jgi:hypothetical protein